MATVSKKQIGIDSRRKTAEGRFYQIVPDDPYISITNALESISKQALIAWSANVEREACIAASTALLFGESNEAAMLDPQLTREKYIQLLKEAIGKQKASTRLATQAAEIGTDTHSLIEWWARTKIGLMVGSRPKVGDKSEWGFMSFEDWAKAHDFKPVRSEMVVFSHVHKVAGTLDLLGYVDGRLKIVDIKTGKAVYAEAKMQCAAYHRCLREMNEACDDSALVLRLPKIDTDPEFEPVDVDNLDYHFRAFLHAKELRLWQIEQEKLYKQALRESVA